MIWLDKIKTDMLTVWLLVVLVIALLSGWVRDIAGWLLLKLYEFFIGSKDHAAPF